MQKSAPKSLLSLILLFLGFSHTLTAQYDSLILSNSNVIVGEIKDMDRGVLTIETDYSDKDFKIEWEGVAEIYSKTYFLITISNGSRYNGYLETINRDSIMIKSAYKGELGVGKDEIVYLKEVDKTFWSRLYASIDLGYSLTKSNNLRQLSGNGKLGYIAEKWSGNFDYSTVNSSQDDVEDIMRTDASLTHRYFLPKDWYTLTQLSFLSNTEQKLNLRANIKVGMGKFVLHTNKSYWGFQAGVAYNGEEFVESSDNRKSMEGFIGTELNLYDIGDLSFLISLVGYPSFTESGRWRSDFKTDLKYDLPLDFYIKLAYTLNFDNRPVEGASDTDYVFQTTFGWEL